jgi:hypothetical protein
MSKNNCALYCYAVCVILSLYMSSVCAELMSSNKKYSGKQRQYKLFAGESEYVLAFRVFFPATLSYSQKESKLRW